MEGVSRHGRATPVCRPPARGRKDGAAVRRVRDLAQDRLQDLRSLQRLRGRRPSAIGAIGAHRQANRLPAPIEATIVRLKREYPGWGAPKIREKLRQQFTGPHLPAISTVHAVLDRHGLVHHRRRRRGTRDGHRTLPTDPTQCALVCRLQRRVSARQSPVCYPLTITDFASRYLLTCEALLTTQERLPSRSSSARSRSSDCPQAIRTDNGVPFAVRLCPLRAQQAGRLVAATGHSDRTDQTGAPATERRHERMHLTLKREATKPAAGQCAPTAGPVR